MLKFHIIIIKFSIFTNKNSGNDTCFPKLKNTIVKIDIKSFSVKLLKLGLNIVTKFKFEKPKFFIVRLPSTIEGRGLFKNCLKIRVDEKT